MAWTQEREAQLKSLWQKHSPREIRAIMGLTAGQLIGKSNRMNLQFRATGSSKDLQANAPAAVEARTVFQQNRRHPRDAKSVLQPGWHNRKIGRTVTKGPWVGMKIYSLTLEERATCPTDCALWLGCYGNSMGRALRIEHGPDLERRLERELRMLGARHPDGFVVRLHILGDFYSAAYVRLWGAWLHSIPQLRVWGYTARTKQDPIGMAVLEVRKHFWPRFMIRQSSTTPGPMRAITIGKDAIVPKGTIVCPAETGLGRSCSSCALCWAEPAKNKTIAFILHGG